MECGDIELRDTIMDQRTADGAKQKVIGHVKDIESSFKVGNGNLGQECSHIGKKK